MCILRATEIHLFHLLIKKWRIAKKEFHFATKDANCIEAGYKLLVK